MSSRGTQFGRTMEYFRTADIDEAQAALGKAGMIVETRMATAGRDKPRQVRRAREKAAAKPVPSEAQATLASAAG
jgi:hypothetical protein